MALVPPRSLSPSALSSFTDCPLAFRFAYVDRLPQPPTVATSKGTLVHRALELLMLRKPAERTLANGLTDLDVARAEYADHPDMTQLALGPDQLDAFAADAAQLVAKYFDLEDPTTIRPVGLELKLQATVGGTRLRGIIDRLELDAQGELVVTDYKTGSVPRAQYEQGKLTGVQLYAILCERVFGRRPSLVQLLYLKGPTAIVAEPTDQKLRGLEAKTGAVWTAVERACATDDFRPKPGRLCDWCSFQAFCPAFGGNPADAKALGLPSATAS
jgi:putative RecB family exonuclease